MEYIFIWYVIKTILLLLGLFFSLMAFWGILSSIEDFKSKPKNREYIIKFIFTLLPLVFWCTFLYVSYSLDV